MIELSLIVSNNQQKYSMFSMLLSTSFNMFSEPYEVYTSTI